MFVVIVLPLTVPFLSHGRFDRPGDLVHRIRKWDRQPVRLGCCDGGRFPHRNDGANLLPRAPNHANHHMRYRRTHRRIFMEGYAQPNPGQSRHGLGRGLASVLGGCDRCIGVIYRCHPPAQQQYAHLLSTQSGDRHP